MFPAALALTWHPAYRSVECLRGVKVSARRRATLAAWAGGGLDRRVLMRQNRWLPVPIVLTGCHRPPPHMG